MAVDKLKSIVPAKHRLDQNEAPIVDAIRDYLARDPVPFLGPCAGVPVLVPGERVTRPIVAFLRSTVAMGATITDVADPQLDTIRVVA